MAWLNSEKYLRGGNEMKEVDEKAVLTLLTALEGEIEAKCIELKEKQRETKLKRAFFFSCFFIMLFFLLQVLLKIFNVNLIAAFFVYQGLALIIIAPVIFGSNRGEFSK
jgi:hypothetical protein